MLTWINFLHLYQPPTQTKEVVDLVARESYSKIIELLKKYPATKFTINFSGSLIELLEKYGHGDLILEYKKLVDEGRIELTGSAMYHPILALLPSYEIVRQIELNSEILKKHFGQDFKPRGFFIPEMAYNKKLASIVKKMGFTWIILDDVHFTQGLPDTSIKYSIENNGLEVLFRSRLFSNAFPPEFIFERRNDIKGTYLITAHDGELYGHWHKDDKGYYEKAFTNADIKRVTVSEYLSELTLTKKIPLHDASWVSEKEDIHQEIPYVLWDHPENTIHKQLWSFANSIIKIVKNHETDPNFIHARTHLDKGLASCAWWWASAKKPSAFSPLTWNPTEIEKGAIEMLTAVRALENCSSDIKVKIEKNFGKLRLLIWNTHWEKYHKR